jgi:Flp pilus assembly protein protease CpaA
MMWEAATIILIAGMVDDFRSRKVHNVLVLALFVVALIASFFTRDLTSSLTGVSALLFALVLTFPLYLAGALGGGDVKLFAVFGFAVDPSAMTMTLLYSVFWGALFGVTRAAIQGQLPMLVRNTYKTLSRQKTAQQELQRMPYTFAMLLGWFTYITMLNAGRI